MAETTAGAPAAANVDTTAEPEDTKWAASEAKKLLRADIIASRV